MINKWCLLMLSPFSRKCSQDWPSKSQKAGWKLWTIWKKSLCSGEDICKDFQICLNTTNLIFREKHYKQIFGTAMGSPVSIVVANLVLEDAEKRALLTFHSPPKIWKHYVDQRWKPFGSTGTNRVTGRVEIL